MPVTSTAISRRKFLKLGAAAGLGLTGFLGASRSLHARAPDEITFGMVTDVHYADKDMRIDRYYRDSIAKLEQCVGAFNESNLAFAVMLGDFIDKAPDRAVELEYLKTMRQVFSQYAGDKHFALGNHDLARLSKAEYLAHCGAVSPLSYYSFDAGGYHFVILDANFRSDETAYEAGNFKWVDAFIPVAEQEWLAQDLRNANGMKTIVFVHQNLHDESSPYGVKNAKTVRRLLEKSGNVLAVMQGHDHKGAYAKINGIHYFTLKALVDGATLKNNSYAIVTMAKSGRVKISGFGRETDKILPTSFNRE
ncbi:MAG: metallophosphoesterase [bacterium]